MQSIIVEEPVPHISEVTKMKKTRKDSKGYVLRTGEYQRDDGTYSYSHTVDGKRHWTYAKTLAELRKKEQIIKRNLEDGVDPYIAERMTLNQLYDKHIEQKYDIKDHTRVNYKYMYDRFVRPSFGMKFIGKIHYSDVKKFYYFLINEKELKANTLECIHTQIHSAFQMAVRDDLLRKNPADDVMTEIKKSHVWKKTKRKALTTVQQKVFVDYLRSHKEYEGWTPVIIVLLGTGLRIGECLALRWDDLDFENNIIRVKRTFIYRPDKNGHSVKHIDATKTASGVRIIPMLDEVREAFLQEYEMQKCMGFCSEEIDGYSDFVFATASGTVCLPSTVNRAIHRVCEAYNREETENAKNEGREPLLLPHFSAHHLRHTFCTRLCENETNLKVLQELMGHSDITTTMNVYAEATAEKKQETIANLQGKIII